MFQFQNVISTTSKGLKNPLIRGTLILTISGIMTRIIGFFYKILLTRSIGAEGMGVFSLIMPLYGVAFAICSSGIQTAISRFSASKRNDVSWLYGGLAISLPISVILTLLMWIYSDIIAERILLNSMCAPLLKVMSLSFPFSTFHNCICGYYYGQSKAGVPAVSQLFEQLIRVGSLYAYAAYCVSTNITITVITAVYSNLAGEAASFLFCIIVLILNHRMHSIQLKKTFFQIIGYSMPLTFNRLLMHLLQSGEAIIIPAQLIIYGHSSSEALSIYGILTGMALPMILFPSAITNSLSVMLLPKISGEQSANNTNAIASTIQRSINLCMSMGIMCTFIFMAYGAKLGSILFDEPSVDIFIMTLSWICPFSYMSVTLGSVLNGLGHTTATCITNIAAVLLRIAVLILFVPSFGISAYMISLLLSQIVVCFAHYIQLSRMFQLSLDTSDSIIIPFLYSFISIAISYFLYAIILYIIGNITICLCIGTFIALISYALFFRKFYIRT